MKRHFTSLLLTCLPLSVCAQHEQRDESTIQFDASHFKKVHIHNHRGSLKVIGVEGNEATIRVKRLLKSASRNRLTQVAGEITLDSLVSEGEVYWFIDAPDRQFRMEENGAAYYQSYQNWNEQRDHRFDVKYEFSLEIEMPRDMPVYAGNHDKELIVQNMQAGVQAKNHHDGVTLTNVGGNVEARSHHGDVVVEFDRNPTEHLICKTHHGDIQVRLRAPLSAEVKLDSHHGDFYTEFDWSPMPLSEVAERTKRGTKYKIGKDTRVKIGGGDLDLSFKTHHGDIYIRKQ